MATIMRFGVFELDLEGERLLKNGRMTRLQPQPFKLLTLLVRNAGRIVTREEIRAALWKDETFVDFEQGVNYAIKQVRDALGDAADSPVYIQTIPKRGYRFLAPVDIVGPVATGDRGTDLNLHKALWSNIVELRLAEEQRRKRNRISMVAISAGLVLLAALWLILT